MQYDGEWYAGTSGIPTGGITSVDAGNIAVFYVLKKLLYSNDIIAIILLLLRFVDDMTGIWTGSMEDFLEWFEAFRSSSVALYGLDFTVEVNSASSWSQFLDIKYKFEDGALLTDVFKKPTDANRFLHFSSYHPRHMFRSIVYSQGLRYRRIINDDAVLDQRLNTLQDYFVRSGYPHAMVSETLQKVRAKQRSLEYRNKDNDLNEDCTSSWVVTYGPGFDEAKGMAQEASEILENSPRQRSSDEPIKIKVTARRSQSLKDLLFKRKSIALQSDQSSITSPCTDPTVRKRGAKCKSCPLMSNLSVVRNNNREVRSSSGNCTTAKVIYAAQCTRCSTNNTYVGKTVTELRQRINGHRASYYSVLKAMKKGTWSIDDLDDSNCLGAHLVLTHNCTTEADFNSFYRFTILKLCDPSKLRYFEQSLIESLQTIVPFGLNNVNSIFG